MTTAIKADIPLAERQSNAREDAREMREGVLRAHFATKQAQRAYDDAAFDREARKLHMLQSVLARRPRAARAPAPVSAAPAQPDSLRAQLDNLRGLLGLT
jgi:hypothetical protein